MTIWTGGTSSCEMHDGHLDHHLQWPPTQEAMHESLQMTRRTKHWSLARQRPLPLLQNLLTANKQPLSSCCCLQLVPINVLRHPDATFTQSSSPLEPPHSKQPTSVQLLLLAASSNQRPQTPWCHLQSVFLSFRTSSQQATNLCPVAAARS